MAKLNPHSLLVDYHPRRDYPQIAQSAAAWVEAHPDGSEQDLLDWAASVYGRQEWLTMEEKPAHLEIFGTVGESIPANAVDQMYTVMRLPMAVRGALMPDAHLGYAMPIGGVASLAETISPSFVGYDISCMVQLSLLDLDPDDFMRHRETFGEALKSVTSFGLGSDFALGEREHEVMESPVWQEIPLLRRLKRQAQTQLGSSGGGNHFADLVIVEYLVDTDEHDAGEELVGLLTHSGSRGTGYKVAKHYVGLAEAETQQVARKVPGGYEWLSLDTDPGREYLAAMRLMGDYARANDDLIHDHFGRAAGVAQIDRIWNRHNYAWVDDASGEVVHRKGATPAERGQMGLIPGTSGSASYLVRGLGNEASLHSSAHGAGRYFSRTEAKRRHDEAAFRRHMQTQDILHYGLAPDETLFAYKDIEMVMELQNGVLVESMARLTPKVVLMGGKADDGD